MGSVPHVQAQKQSKEKLSPSLVPAQCQVSLTLQHPKASHIPKACSNSQGASLGECPGIWALGSGFQLCPSQLWPCPSPAGVTQNGTPWSSLCYAHRDSGSQVEHSCVSPGSLVLEENLVRAVVGVQSWSQSHIPFPSPPAATSNCFWVLQPSKSGCNHRGSQRHLERPVWTVSSPCPYVLLYCTDVPGQCCPADT